jgi:hypothetical protein
MYTCAFVCVFDSANNVACAVLCVSTARPCAVTVQAKRTCVYKQCSKRHVGPRKLHCCCCLAAAVALSLLLSPLLLHRITLHVVYSTTGSSIAAAVAALSHSSSSALVLVTHCSCSCSTRSTTRSTALRHEVQQKQCAQAAHAHAAACSEDNTHQ